MKIECGFGGGGDTILFAPKGGEFSSYEKDSEALHSRFGGKAYYSSLSGLSGAGYLLPPPSDPLIEVGSYRTDARLSPHPAPATLYEKIQCFVPHRSHQGIDGTKPLVLAEGSKVAMVAEHFRVWEVLSSWGDEEKWRVIEIPAYTNQGSFDPIHLQVQGRGVSALPFVSHPRVTEAREWANTVDCGPWQHSRDWPIRALGWFPTQKWEWSEEAQGSVPVPGDGWLHQAKDGYFDAYSPDVHPLDMEGEIPGGWVVDPDEFFFWQVRRVGAEQQVYGFLWDFGEGGESATEYEIEVPVVAFFARGTAHYVAMCREGIARKRAAAAEYQERLRVSEEARRVEGIAVKELLSQNPALEFSIADSLAMGNCQVGTLAWLARHGIKPTALTETRTAAQLLAHSQIDAMCADDLFARVVRAKVASPQE